MVISSNYYGKMAAAGLYSYANNSFAAKKPVRRSYSREALMYVKKKPKRMHSLKKSISEMKPALHYGSSSILSLVHDSYFTLFPTQALVQGTSGAQRLGDSVRLEAIKIKGLVQTAAAANGYSYRIIVGYSTQEIAAATTFITTGLSATTLFQPNTANNWGVNGIVNAKAFTVLSDTTIDINSQITATIDLESFAFTVPLQADFDYQSSGSVYGKTRNLCIVVIGDVVGGTSAVTSSGTSVFAWDLIFKNN